MGIINILTNPDKLVESKAGFFADYFYFHAAMVGHFYETSIETPLSLVEKIQFQLQNNHTSGKVKYILNYLEHDYFRRDQFLKLFPSYLALKKDRKDFLSIPGTDKESNKKREAWLDSNKQFGTHLMDLQQELETGIAQKSLQYLVSYFVCKHELKKHQVAIKELTSILVCEAFFANRTKFEIQRVFNRILSREINAFPFPENIKETEDKKKFISSRDIRQQFDGLLNFIKEKPEKYHFILRVYGAALKKDDSFRYKSTEFSSPDHVKFNSIREELKKYDAGLDSIFFQADNYLFVCIEMDVYNKSPNINKAIKIIQEELSYVSLVLNKPLSLDIDSYLYTKDFKILEQPHINLFDPKKELDQFDIENLDDNPYVFLKQYAGPATTTLFDHEQIFINASLYGKLDQFWRYIENLFSFRKETPKKIEICAGLLLLDEKEHRGFLIKEFLLQVTIPWEFDYSKLGVNVQDFVSSRNNISAKGTKQFYKLFNYPLFNELKKIESKKYTQKQYAEVKQYYASILLELYEARNSITHQNNVHLKAEIKLRILIPKLISRIRRILFSLIRKDPSRQLHYLAERAYVESLKLSD